MNKDNIGMGVLFAGNYDHVFPDTSIVGLVRAWDSGTYWPKAGSADASRLEAYLTRLFSSGRSYKVLLALGKRGTHSYSQADVEAVAHNIVSEFGTRIEAVEIINEPNTAVLSITPTQCAQMCQWAYPILHAAGIKVAAPCPQGSKGNLWMEQFIQAGGAKYCDALSAHMYAGSPGTDMSAYANKYVTLRAKYGLQAKPLWHTEFNIFKGYSLSAAQAAAFVKYAYAAVYNAGFQRNYWYAWDIFAADAGVSIQMINTDRASLNASGLAIMQALDQLITGPAPPPNPSDPYIVIDPSDVYITQGTTYHFAADERNTTDPLTWSVDGIDGGNSTVGTVDSLGFYTAPGTDGDHIVEVRLATDATVNASATVHVGAVLPPPPGPPGGPDVPAPLQPIDATVFNQINQQLNKKPIFVLELLGVPNIPPPSQPTTQQLLTTVEQILPLTDEYPANAAGPGTMVRDVELFRDPYDNLLFTVDSQITGRIHCVDGDTNQTIAESADAATRNQITVDDSGNLYAWRKLSDSRDDAIVIYDKRTLTYKSKLCDIKFGGSAGGLWLAFFVHPTMGKWLWVIQYLSFSPGLCYAVAVDAPGFSPGFTSNAVNVTSENVSATVALDTDFWICGKWGSPQNAWRVHLNNDGSISSTDLGDPGSGWGITNTTRFVWDTVDDTLIAQGNGGMVKVDPGSLTVLLGPLGGLINLLRSINGVQEGEFIGIDSVSAVQVVDLSTMTIARTIDLTTFQSSTHQQSFWEPQTSHDNQVESVWTALDNFPGQTLWRDIVNQTPPSGAPDQTDRFVGVLFSTKQISVPNFIVNPWIDNIDEYECHVNDTEGGSDQGELHVTVQDRKQWITNSLVNFVYEGVEARLKTGFVGMDYADFPCLFVGAVDHVDSDRENNAYTFVCYDNYGILQKTIYNAATDANPHIVQGHPIDILIDVFLNQLGLDPTRINLPKLYEYRDGVFAGMEYKFKIKSVPIAKDFIENELMKPMCAYYFINKVGVFNFNFFYPLDINPSFTADRDMAYQTPTPEQSALVNSVIYRFDADDNDKFLAEDIETYLDSVNLYGLFGQTIIESKGMRSGLQGFAIAKLMARLIFIRYGMKQLQFDQPCRWNALFLEPGDKVLITNPHIPNRRTGTMGYQDALFEVIGYTIDFKNGRVTLKLLDAFGLSAFKAYYIAPDALADYASATAAERARYMFLSSDTNTYSNGDPGNTLA